MSIHHALLHDLPASELALLDRIPEARRDEALAEADKAGDAFAREQVLKRYVTSSLIDPDVARRLAQRLADGTGMAHEVRFPGGAHERIEPAPADRVTAEELAEIARLDAAATPGPWVAVYEDDGDIVLSDGGETHYPAAGEDYAFIRRARTLLPKFAAEVTALRAENEDVHKRCASYAVRCSLETEADLRAKLEALREKARAVAAILTKKGDDAYDEAESDKNRGERAEGQLKAAGDAYYEAGEAIRAEVAA